MIVCLASATPCHFESNPAWKKRSQKQVSKLSSRQVSVIMNEAVSAYIAQQPQPQRDILTQLRDCIHKVAPEATEAMSYGVPAFKLQGKGNLILYAAFKHHIGVYPEPESILFFAEELQPYETAKGSIKFPLSEPMPYALIEKIVKHRVEVVTNKSQAKTK